MTKHGVSEQKIVKIRKKGPFFDQFCGFPLKRVPEIRDPHIL